MLLNGLVRANDLSGLSFWLTCSIIEARGPEDTGFLSLGVLACGHGRLHRTLGNVAKIGGNFTFCSRSGVRAVVVERR
jgi:hypothetical protein